MKPKQFEDFIREYRDNHMSRKCKRNAIRKWSIWREIKEGCKIAAWLSKFENYE